MAIRNDILSPGIGPAVRTPRVVGASPPPSRSRRSGAVCRLRFVGSARDSRSIQMCCGCCRATAPPSRRFATYLQHFGTLDDLYVVFSTAEGTRHPRVCGRHRRVGRGAAGRTGADARRQRTDRRQRVTGAGWPIDSCCCSIRSGSRKRSRGCSLQGMPAALAATRELLSLPSADIAALVREDPLGLSELLRAQLGGSRSALQIGSSPDGYLTADGRRRLIIARPKRPPFDAAFSRALFARLEAIAAERAALGPE